MVHLAELWTDYISKGELLLLVGLPLPVNHHGQCASPLYSGVVLNFLQGNSGAVNRLRFFEPPKPLAQAQRVADDGQRRPYRVAA